MGNDIALTDGQFVQRETPVVPVRSRGLMYGDGCFDTLRAYEGKFFRLGDHIDRLQSAALFLGIDYPDDLLEKSLKNRLLELLEKNGLKNSDAIVRIQLWRKGGRGYKPESARPNGSYAVLASPLPDIPESVHLASVGIRRIPNQALPANYKLSNNLNYIIAAREADQQKADDALMLTLDGHVSETTIANIFWIKGRTVYTPSVECDLLPGITRKILIELMASQTEYDLNEGAYELGHLLEADAAWICNSVRELVPVQRINDTTFGIRHRIIDQLSSLYSGYKEQEMK